MICITLQAKKAYYFCIRKTKTQEKMKVEQLYTACLSEMAYYVESNGEVAIIDPLRDPAPYIEMAKENNATIKWVLLTHFHADFVSGHIDLAKKTGATIVFGPNATANFDFYQAEDQEFFALGNAKIQLLHTPGHTMESSSYVLIDENGNKPYICTGDTLFIGDVGRPDLAVKSNLTEADLAEHLFDSLRNKIMPLPDDIIIYPNHGAGSACGKNMSKETFDTLGNQKKANYALRADMTKAEFVKEVTTGLASPPQYFPKNVALNKNENISFDNIVAQGTKALNLEEFKTLSQQKDVLILDTRSGKAFTQTGTIPKALWIGIDGGFAPWVGTLIENIKQKIIIVAEENRVREVVSRLARVGYDNAIGYLAGGMQTWLDANLPTSKVQSIGAEELLDVKNTGKTILDVRKASEYASEHIEEVDNFPLSTIYENIDSLNQNETYYLHCAGGYRSLIASSIFLQNNILNVVDVRGGFGAIRKTKIELTQYVCPTTLL